MDLAAHDQGLQVILLFLPALQTRVDMSTLRQCLALHSDNEVPQHVLSPLQIGSVWTLGPGQGVSSKNLGLKGKLGSQIWTEIEQQSPVVHAWTCI